MNDPRTTYVLGDRDAEDLRQVLSTPAGQRLYHRIIYGVCNLEGGTWFPATKDGECLKAFQAYAEGMRNVGRILNLEAEANCIDLYLHLRAKYFSDRIAELVEQTRASQPSAGDPTK